MIKEFQKEYRWLSNFMPVKIILDGIEYPSVEHAYMSAKSDDINWKAFCANVDNKPGKVKQASKFITIIPNWNYIKIGVMRDCLIQKFSQEPYKDLLIKTKDLYIQEGNRWNDKFWGVCLKTNTGKNVLGNLIMEIRKDLLTSNT